MEISEIRRQNLRILMKQSGAAKLSERLGNKYSSFLSQMAGPNPTREVTEKTARAYEKKLDLPVGAFDKPLDEIDSTEKQMSTDQLIAMVLSAARAIGSICETQSINLAPRKIASVLALVIKDSMEHGGVVREDHIKEVVELLK